MERRAKTRQVIERVVADLKANDLFVVDEASGVNDKEIEAAMSRASAPGRGGSFVGSVMVFPEGFPEADIVDRALEESDKKRRQFKKRHSGNPKGNRQDRARAWVEARQDKRNNRRLDRPHAKGGEEGALLVTWRDVLFGMKKPSKKFEYRDRSPAKLDFEFGKEPIFDLADIAKALAIPPSYLGIDEDPKSNLVRVGIEKEPKLDWASAPKAVKQEITMELSEDAVTSLEPFFAKVFADAVGDGIKQAFSAVTFDDISKVMLDVNKEVANSGSFVMSSEAFEQLQRELGRSVEEYEEERREREEQLEAMLRAAEGIERARNLDLLKIKQKLFQLRQRPSAEEDDDDEDDEVFFDQGTRAVRVRERIGGPSFRFERNEILEVSYVPPPSDPQALAIVGEEGPEALTDATLAWEPVKIEIPTGAILEVDAKLYANPPAGWEPVQGIRALKKIT